MAEVTACRGELKEANKPLRNAQGSSKAQWGTVVVR